MHEQQICYIVLNRIFSFDNVIKSKIIYCARCNIIFFFIKCNNICKIFKRYVCSLMRLIFAGILLVK